MSDGTGDGPWWEGEPLPEWPEGEASRAIREIELQLRGWCAEIGDNEWPRDLHPADVIDKHLVRPAIDRIQALDAEVRRLRAVIEDIDAERYSTCSACDEIHTIARKALRHREYLHGSNAADETR